MCITNATFTKIADAHHEKDHLKVLIHHTREGGPLVAEAAAEEFGHVGASEPQPPDRVGAATPPHFPC